MPLIKFSTPLPRPKLPSSEPCHQPDQRTSPLPWFRECTPKILVVTDGLNFDNTSDFGLTEFVDTLRASTIHGMTPIVITAQFEPDPQNVLSYNSNPNAPHISNYKFTDVTHGILKSRYDIVFLLSINLENYGLANEPGAIDAITAFMQAGGGLFATGDHEDLGAGMCKDIPRVRNMRYWTNTPPQIVPSAGGTDRLTTILPGRGDIAGSNDEYEFSDQSDQFPQRLYVNFRTVAGGVGFAHPLLQLPATSRAIEVFPDHPHEGECIIPSNLNTKLADGITDEWPLASGARISPEMVALTMSHGNTASGKEAVTPRSFIAICAYDGQSANVGRVVTDATWHHFVNINICPGFSALAGRDLKDIKQYYVNLATWLMPKNVRLCLRYPMIFAELLRYPLFEEISPIPREKIDGLKLRNIGALVERALLNHHTQAEVKALIGDALEEAIGIGTRLKLEEHGRMICENLVRDAGVAAIGSLTLAIAERFNEVKDRSDLNGEKVFGDVGGRAVKEGVKLYLQYSRKNLGTINELIDSITC